MIQCDPFRIVGPAVVSFSGGRTSAYMLRRILDAHGGQLPADVVAVFANTGREMPGTLDFIQQCSERWAVPVAWVEFTVRRGDGYRVVTHNSASRAGEPFEALIDDQSALPNPVARTCTTWLKIKPIERYATAVLGPGFRRVLGLRADETGRADKLRTNGALLPLADAGVTLFDVRAFWRRQSFDLHLRGRWESNCDGCLLKGRALLLRMARDHPQRIQWWARQEAKTGNTFRNPYEAESYAVLLDYVRRQPELPLDETMVEGGEPCGVHCGV